MIARFRNPTVAEAILTARDRHLKTLDANDRGGYDLRRADDSYADALSDLGDRTILPELKRRFAQETQVNTRRRWALICLALKDDAPLRELAAAFKSGTIKLPENGDDTSELEERAGSRELVAFVHAFTEVRQPYCDEALDALGAPTHPYHAMALELTSRFTRWRTSDNQRLWFSHPYFVHLVRPMLNRTEATKERYTLEPKGYKVELPGSMRRRDLPDALKWAAPEELLASATGRACDESAMMLDEFLIGAPAYHPLFKDCEARLEALRDFVDRFSGKLRPLSYRECQALNLSNWNTAFVPNIAPLKRAATAADVAAGRAIFELAGHGTAAEMLLPATAALKKDRGIKDAPRVLIVQAERDEAKTLHYGIVERHQLRAVGEDELENIKPIVVSGDPE